MNLLPLHSIESFIYVDLDLSFPGVQGGSASTQMQAWAPGVLLKSSNTADSVSSSAPNPINGPSTFMPISINTGTFPGTPAVRLIGDCHFLHRLCQLLHFCFIFRRTQLARYNGPNPPNKVEEASSAVKPIAGGQVGAGGKGSEEGPSNRSRIGSGNAGQGYTYDEVNSIYTFFSVIAASNFFIEFWHMDMHI